MAGLGQHGALRRQGLGTAWNARLALVPGFSVQRSEPVGSEVVCRNLGRELMHLLFVLRPQIQGDAKVAFVLAISRGCALYPPAGLASTIFGPTICGFSSVTVFARLATRFLNRETGSKSVIKAACHIHSEWSYDGKWSLPKLAAGSGGGLSRVAHDRATRPRFTQARLLEYCEACARARLEQVLIVPGIEYSDADNIVHTLVWGPVSFG
jgi:hypothetical protein